MFINSLFKKKLVLWLCFLGCISSFAQSKIERPVPLNPNKTLQTIAFGSCNNQAKKQVIWPSILKNQPDLWIWLGDNIYGDTEDMRVMSAKYQRLKVASAYRFFRSKCPVVGIWDDHDFGVNDGCKTYPAKARSKELLFDFLEVPKESPAWRRSGAYQTYTFGPRGKRVRVILLDARYFRDILQPAPKDSGQRYKPNETGTILGESQWTWLEKILTESKADVHIIASGIQIIPTQHEYEKWGNFPKERQRLLNLLTKICPSNPILLSGDRHMAEVSEITIDGYKNPIKEITASGMTHGWPVDRKEPNQYRVGEKVIEKNFAVLNIDWEQSPVAFEVEVRGVENQLYHSLKWSY